MSEILPRFIDALQQANLDVTGREVAEILWLALQMSTATEEVVRAPEQDGNLSQPSGEVLPSMDTKPSSQPTSKSSSAKTKPTSEVHLHSQKSSSKSKGYQGAILARMPAAQALGETLVLGRALRPLRRRYPSRKTLVLNVQATVRRIAEMQKRVWEPVVEPALMRWFDLALVIDEGASMIFWQQTITELRTLFEQLGAFRDIRVWRLATNQKEEIQLYAGTRASTVQQPARNPKELIDPTGRRLILVVTDCVSPAWYSGKVQEVLELWGQKNLVTLLHMFPRRLWPRTALCAAQTARISASAPGMANVHLKTPGARSRLATELSMPIPVVTLDQKSLASWSRIVLGAESTGASGIMFAKDISKVFAETASMQEDEDALTPQERVRDFWAAASPTARRLARLLSATPISLPIVHLIQQTMLSERKPEHVAEVFLGGLLKEIYRDHTTTHPEYIEYEFLPGVKEELFNALPMPDEYQVLREISRFVENRLGLSRDFLGRIALPTSSEGLTIDPESRPFARIATTVWRKLGGDYAAYADKLDQMLNGHSTQPIEVPTEFREAGEELQSEVKREIVSTAPTSPSVHYTTAKVALVGDSGVGKTGLGYRIAEERFQVTESTHGQQFWVVDKLSTTRNDGAQCEAVLWDFAGQPKFRAIHALFLDDVDLALVLFDPARPDTFTGVDYWLKQLSYQGRLYPTILVAARTDVSKLSISSTELESFCRERNISGGFIATSAKTGAGVNELLEMIRQQIDWNTKPTTITTRTVKRIRDYVLALKADPQRTTVLVSPTQLRVLLEATDPGWQFGREELMGAVGHLQNHGYVMILGRSSNEQSILLVPDLLINLSSSYMLKAQANEKGLGALVEAHVLRNEYKFPEVENLSNDDRYTLLDAVTELFLNRNICFRQSVDNQTYLIFPSLILERPPRMVEDTELVEDMTYMVTGSVENIYPTLVVLLGYSPSFQRVNQWRKQAQYESTLGLICGFKVANDEPGELELVLYYHKDTPDYVRSRFQGLFEETLYAQNVTIKKYMPIFCPNCGREQERQVVIRHIEEGAVYLFCQYDGERIQLPKQPQRLVLSPESRDVIARDQLLTKMRTTYETALVRVKRLIRDRGDTISTTCFVSYSWGDSKHERWILKMADDLRKADIDVILDRWEGSVIGSGISRFISRIEKADFIIIVGTPSYRKKYENKVSDYGSIVAAEVDLINLRLTGTEEQKASTLPVLLQGDQYTSFPPLLQSRVYADFRREEYYFVTLFDLVLTLYHVPFHDPVVRDLREKLREEAETFTVVEAEVPTEVKPSLEKLSGSRDILVSQVDFAIITIRTDEFAAVLQRFPTKVQKGSSGRTYGVSEVHTKTGKNCRVAIVRSSEQGNDATQQVANDVINDLDPQMLLVVGIAGGVPSEDFTLGDVIISTRIANLNVSKRFEDGREEFDIRGGIHPGISDITASLLLYQKELAGWNDPNSITLNRPKVDLQQFETDEFRAKIADGQKNAPWYRKVRASITSHFGGEKNRARPPLFETGTIASSNGLIRNIDLFVQWLQTARNILVVEMESAGVYQATQRIQHQYRVMAIRGISDIIGLERDNQWTKYACQTAAAFAYAFVTAGVLTPRENTHSSNETAIVSPSPSQRQVKAPHIERLKEGNSYGVVMVEAGSKAAVHQAFLFVQEFVKQRRQNKGRHITLMLQRLGEKELLAKIRTNRKIKNEREISDNRQLPQLMGPLLERYPADQVAFVLLITASPVLDYDDWVEQDHWAGRLWLASLGKWQPYGGEMVALRESTPLTLEIILKTSGEESATL